MRKLFAVLLLAVVLNSCAQTSIVKTPIYKDSDIEVTLYGAAPPDASAYVRDYSHPALFEVEALKYLLISIQYQEKGLFGWATARKVFSANELNRITPHFVEAFARATPGDEIVFSSDAAKSGGLFLSARLTSGRMFVKDNKLHCIFGNINVRPGSMNDSFDDPYDIDDDPRREHGGSLSRLVTNNWQKLVEDAKGVHYNWVEIDIDEGLAEKADRESAARRRAQRQRAIQQERLRDSVYWEDWEPDQPLEVE
jgi:hypothetical protein